jgi:hypothetical protein
VAYVSCQMIYDMLPLCCCSGPSEHLEPWIVDLLDAKVTTEWTFSKMHGQFAFALKTFLPFWTYWVVKKQVERRIWFIHVDDQEPQLFEADQ